MKKTYKMFLALMLLVLGAATVSAGERVTLTNDMFYSYETNQWGADAQKTGKLDLSETPALGEASSCPFGDTSCNAWLDCTKYAKLFIKMEGCDADGTPNGSNPRVFINRTADNGQFNADEAQSNCLVIPNDGTWAANYYTKDGDTYVIDLTKIKQKWGFCHLHSIKGSAWNTKAIVYSVEAEMADKSQMIGWINLIDNDDLEGEDNSFFVKKEAPAGDEGITECPIEEGIGMNDSRGIKVHAEPRVSYDHETQFWIYFKEQMEEGTTVRLSFDYKATGEFSAATQTHEKAGEYIFYDIFGKVDFTTEWQHFQKEVTVTAQMAKNSSGKVFRSVALNLSPEVGADAIDYYFDNIKFEYFKVGTSAKWHGYAAVIDFGHKTNIADLVKASGKTRLVYPEGCATVKMNGEEVTLISVEGMADGRLAIFMDVSDTNETDLVEISFKNPEDAAYQIIYAEGPNEGKPVGATECVAEFDQALGDEVLLPESFVLPVLVWADPEDGAFNLKNDIREFKVRFDKEVQGGEMVATLDKEKLTVAPAELSKEFTLTRTGAGALTNGLHKINLTKVYPEMSIEETVFTDTTLVISVGKVEVDPNDTVREVIPEAYFAASLVNSVPEGFKLLADDGTERLYPNTSYGSGNRIMEFAAGGDFTRGLYFRTYHVEYGTIDGYELNLEADKPYQVSFNAANWTSGDRYLNFQVFKASDLNNAIFSKVVKCEPALNEKRDAVKGSTKVEFTYQASETGQYVMRWCATTGADGTPTESAWSNGVILANVKVVYVPTALGVKETLLLNTAIANAKAVRDDNSAERYNGEAFTALDAAIQKYEAEMANYTNPSQFTDAAATLDAAGEALKDHRLKCDNYDTQIKKAIDLVRQNKYPNGGADPATKYVATELFGEVEALVDKYHGASQWKADTTYQANIDDPSITDTIVGQAYLVYEYDVLKDDAQLTAAIDELTKVADNAALLFTSGASACSDTGVKVLFERIRLGIDDLISLGVEEDDELIVNSNLALTDDDDVAEGIKNRIKLIIYGDLQKGKDSHLFDPIIDTETLEETPRSYDVSVFVKNPNVYKLSEDMNYTDEAVPGWVVPDGFNRPGLSCGWGASRGNSVVAEDCMFQTWGGSYRVEQTMVDLPAGIYTIKIGFGERMQDDASSNMAESFVYAKTADTPAVEEIEDRTVNFAGTADCIGIGQSFPNANTVIENVVVTDGILTIGANASQGSHTFFNDARLIITGSAAGFDYKTAYDEIVAGIDVTEVRPAKVLGIQLFDLNGRRIPAAQKGIVIVKKYMNDGTISVEKVVKK